MTEHDVIASVPAPTLRERRRARTAAQISDVALDLFERYGSAATTVDEIAEAAGVSQRTFFRYFARKEHAAFWTEVWNKEQALRLVDEAALAVRRGREPLRALTESCSRVYVEFDNNDVERRRVLRQNRLVHSEPALAAVALQQEFEIAEMAVAKLRGALAADFGSFVPRVVVKMAFALFRSTHEEWTRLMDQGDDVSFVATFDLVINAYQQTSGELHLDRGATT